MSRAANNIRYRNPDMEPGALRKAGAFLRNIDDAYSSKIRDMYEGANPAVRAAAYTVGGGHPSFRKGIIVRDIGPETRRKQGLREAMEYAIPAINAVPKYVLPAAGVTLAGKGLIDLASALGQQTESTLEV